MDQVINATRSLGKILQTDSRFTRYMQAQQANDNDAQLQDMITKFHDTRLALNNEMSKADKDQDAITALDSQLKEVYGEIMANENMVELSAAKDEMETLLTFVNQIITGASNGQDPDTIEFSASCGGSCSSCAGCG